MNPFGNRSGEEMGRRAEAIRRNHPDLWQEAAAIVTAARHEEMDEWTASEFDVSARAFVDREGETGLRVLWASARILGDARIRRRCVLFAASALAEEAVAGAVAFAGLMPTRGRGTAQRVQGLLA